MKAEIKALVSGVLKGDVRALARAISHIENSSSIGKECVEKLFPHTGNSFVIGITGSPGAGKSTLVDRLATALAEKGKRVAVLAIDPSSPYSGGAILGDRIRMANSLNRKNVYVRSMASRGALGGLAPQTLGTVFALDAAKFDFILLETVGVGQGEIEIVRVADCVLVVLVPGMGDGIQAMKAGILEIADIFVINKADFEGADRLKQELVNLMSLAPPNQMQNKMQNVARPKIVETVATAGEGIRQLLSEMDKFQQTIRSEQRLKEKRTVILQQLLERELTAELLTPVMEFLKGSGLLQSAIGKLRNRQASPQKTAKKLIASYEVAKGKRAQSLKALGKRRRKSPS